MVSVVVLDYGSGNIRSAHRALERAGATVTVTADRDAAVSADGLVIPGVGAYAACMAGLDAVDARAVVAARLAADAPVLGICVGMQVLFDSGVEHGEETAGMGLIAGSVTPIAAEVVPHMGWNTVAAGNGSRLFDGFAADTRFYFVHSYAAHTAGADVVTTTTYGEPFVSAVESGVLAATQFHPEKSGDAGAHLLENWVKSL